MSKPFSVIKNCGCVGDDHYEQGRKVNGNELTHDVPVQGYGNHNSITGVVVEAFNGN